MSTERVQRTIVIAGRPNVGKSALFNRIIRRRLAIVHEQSGVTRDRLACETNWEGEVFELVDTGGLSLIDAATSKDKITDGTQKQVTTALEDASVIIFVVDITAGITHMDLEVARILRQGGHNVLVAANKSDNDGLEPQAVEFEEFGFPIFPTSALHNRGIADLMETAIKALPPYKPSQEEPPLKVAIVGRPNAGKSSYLNRILNNDRLIVSDVPGTTRDSIEIPFRVNKGKASRNYMFIDTAGIRHARKVKTAVDKFSLIRAERSIRDADVVVLMLDATQGPSTQDKKIAGKILEYEKGCLLIINKWDLAEGEVTQRKYGAALNEAVPFLSFAPTVFTSAETGYNIRRSIDAIDHVADQVRSKLSTSILNRVLHKAFEKVSPPHVKQKRMKFFYATQVGTQPLRIKLFVNNPKSITEAYRRYLIRSLRESYGLEGAPIVLIFTARRRD